MATGLASASKGRRGTNLLGLVKHLLPLADHLAIARAVAGHGGPVVAATPRWLTEHGVQMWMGPHITAAVERRSGLVRPERP